MFEIYNSWKIEHKSIFGALKMGQSCKFSIRISNKTDFDDSPVMIIFRTGFKERFLKMQEVSRTEEYTEFMTDYTPNLMGVHYYYFGLINDGKRFFIKRQQASIGKMGEGELFQLTVYDDLFETPSFIKNGIMYQIFPDRFCNSGTQKSDIPHDRYIHQNWGETPLFHPDQSGHIWNNDYFGGDLQGIIQKLEYLKSLNVTCIYLNPIFEAHENHRYNTANYLNVDPHLGTNADFKELCDKAKEMGISVILDGVFNHTGADSIYFNKFNRYDTLGAYNSKASSFYQWYTFDEFPDQYESWWGIDTLPNVNETNKDFLDYICGENGVLDYWLKLGASGYRLDVADELPDEFLDALNNRVKGVSKENLIIGEVWEDASNKESYGVKRRYLLGQQLDSVMNYPFKDAVMAYISGGSPSNFYAKIMTILENYPKPTIDCLMNFLSTHDIMRAITGFGGDIPKSKSKEWQADNFMSPEQYENGKNLLKCAMVLQYFLPGVPSIYYGDEVGLQGYGDPFNRRCYPWGNEDTELLGFVKALGEIRINFADLLDGDFSIKACEDSFISIMRSDKNGSKAMIIILNKSYHEMRFDTKIEFGNYKNFEAIRGNISENTLVIPQMEYAVIKVLLK